jgi:hypothetical protein
MKHLLLRSIFLMLCLCALPGCGRYVNWGTDLLYQGDQLPIESAAIQHNLRSVAVYDQLQTRAIFDALWLCNDVRISYTRLYMRKHGKEQDEYSSFLRRQLEENKHYISFYVLSLANITLGDANSPWGVFLHIAGKDLMPAELKVVEMPAEYTILFGNKFSRFKTAYSVKFNTRDIEEDPVITQDSENMKLIFRSYDKEVMLSWDFHKKG